MTISRKSSSKTQTWILSHKLSRVARLTKKNQPAKATVNKGKNSENNGVQ